MKKKLKIRRSVTKRRIKESSLNKHQRKKYKY